MARDSARLEDAAQAPARANVTLLLRRHSAYGLAALLALTVPAFWPSYLHPAAVERDYHVHFHGISMFAWTVLLVAQATLIRTGRTAFHRALGSAAYALGPAIVQQLFGPAGELSVIALDGELERVLTQVLTGPAAESGGIEPDLADTIVRELGNAVRQQDAAGLPPVLITSDRLRAPLARLVRRGAPQLRVLAHSEIPSSRALRARIVIGGKA